MPPVKGKLLQLGKGITDAMQGFAQARGATECEGHSASRTKTRPYVPRLNLTRENKLCLYLCARTATTPAPAAHQDQSKERSGGSVKTIALGHGTRVTDAFLGTTEVTVLTELV